MHATAYHYLSLVYFASKFWVVNKPTNIVCVAKGSLKQINEACKS